ncbi:MAG: exodeoxyribonuclease VII large subunit [Bacteroidota bacterium]|nr:exodeoxyribonuclease VII large subunit [Bacteroidota bacterium]
MAKKYRLSELVSEIDETIQNRFAGETFWITAEITDVKPQDPSRNYRFIKFIEKSGTTTLASIDAVFWAKSLNQIEKFEKTTKTTLRNGLELTCKVVVSFNNRYGLKLEIIEIDCTYALGQVEIERQQTIEKLLKENPKTIRRVDEQFITFNKTLELPIVIQRIALITAPNSDGQRDFNQELKGNKHKYIFNVSEFLTQIQGDSSSKLIVQKLKLIEEDKESYDIVVIARGGGSQSDLQPFDDYELSKYVAAFPIPVFTGIGHDRNTSIVDLMARQHKTPTKVATSIVDHNFNFESDIIDFKERFFDAAESMIDDAKESLLQFKRTVKAYSPATILNKGYAIITSNDRIIINPKDIKPNTEIKTILKNELIHSTVTKKTKNGINL